MASYSFRHDFDIVDAKINSLHAPRTHQEVNRNLEFFFPEERILVTLKPNLTDQQRGKHHRHVRTSTPCTYVLTSSGNCGRLPKSALLCDETQNGNLNAGASVTPSTCTPWQRLLR
jgi:hypothetical protein